MYNHSRFEGISNISETCTRCLEQICKPLLLHFLRRWYACAYEWVRIHAFWFLLLQVWFLIPFYPLLLIFLLDLTETVFLYSVIALDSSVIWLKIARNLKIASECYYQWFRIIRNPAIHRGIYLFFLSLFIHIYIWGIFWIRILLNKQFISL